jgi:ParB/RepB/Spo0J family partition protein
MDGTEGSLQTVLIANIRFHNETNGRANLDPRRVQELADALAHEPLLHPITLRSTPTGLVLVAGRHRLAAFHKLGRLQIPARILHLDDTTEAQLRLSENLQRVTLSPVEQAKQLADLVELEAQGVETVARRLGRSVDWILDRLEILTWPDELITHVHTKRIPLAAAKLLARIQPQTIRAMRIHDAATHGCSAATARLWLQTAGHDDPDAPPPPVFSSQGPIYETTTTTKVICAGCTELKRIEETQLVRWCNDCLSSIQIAQRAHRDPSPCTTPTIYQPPQPTTSPQHTATLQPSNPSTLSATAI